MVELAYTVVLEATGHTGLEGSSPSAPTKCLRRLVRSGPHPFKVETRVQAPPEIPKKFLTTD